MSKLRDRSEPLEPEAYLRLATQASTQKEAGAVAQWGLDATEQTSLPADPEARVLLLREVFKAHLVAGRRRSAHALARKMVREGALAEVTHADLGRVCSALGWWTHAAQAFRLAARFAPANRRALHWGACASALHHGEKTEEALAALERAIRWSTATKPLHRAHAILIQLDGGRVVSPGEVRQVRDELAVARCGEGYGRYVLGLLSMELGELESARGYLREFAKRNLGDPMRSASLSGELRRVKRVLRELRDRAASGA